MEEQSNYWRRPVSKTVSVDDLVDAYKKLTETYDYPTNYVVSQDLFNYFLRKGYINPDGSWRIHERLSTGVRAIQEPSRSGTQEET